MLSSEWIMANKTCNIPANSFLSVLKTVKNEMTSVSTNVEWEQFLRIGPRAIKWTEMNEKEKNDQ